MKRRKYNKGDRVRIGAQRKGVVIGFYQSGNAWNYVVKLIPKNGDINNYPQEALKHFRK